MKQQNGDSSVNGEDDGDVPVAAESVSLSLIPNRRDGGMLVNFLE